MKIAVAIKQVPLRDSPLRVNAAGTWIDEDNLGFEINEPDAYALEEALQLREKHGGEVPRTMAELHALRPERLGVSLDGATVESYQALRGVDRYVDPINNWNVDLPTGYDNAWTNGTDYVFSDSPSFNPNTLSTGNWQRMTPKR